MHRYGNTAGVGAAACPAGGRRVPARILFALDPDAPEGPLYAPLPRSLPARFSGSIRQAYAATLGAALAAPPGKELDAVPSCPYANGPALPGGSAAMGADAALCAAWMVGASLALELLAGRAAVVEEPATPGRGGAGFEGGAARRRACGPARSAPRAGEAPSRRLRRRPGGACPGDRGDAPGVGGERGQRAVSRSHTASRSGAIAVIRHRYCPGGPSRGTAPTRGLSRWLRMRGRNLTSRPGPAPPYSRTRSRRARRRPRR